MTLKKKLVVAFFVFGFVVAGILGFLIKFYPIADDGMAVSQARAYDIAEAARKYFASYGRWPTNLAQLKLDPRWSALETNDAWGEAIEFTPYDPGAGYGMVRCFGADRKPYGVGTNGDSFVIFGHTPTSGEKMLKQIQLEYQTNR